MSKTNTRQSSGHLSKLMLYLKKQITVPQKNKLHFVVQSWHVNLGYIGDILLHSKTVKIQIQYNMYTQDKLYKI